MKYTAAVLLGFVTYASAEACKELKMDVCTDQACSSCLGEVEMESVGLNALDGTCKTGIDLATSGAVSIDTSKVDVLSYALNGAKASCDASGISYSLYGSSGCDGDAVATGVSEWGKCIEYGMTGSGTYVMMSGATHLSAAAMAAVALFAAQF